MLKYGIFLESQDGGGCHAGKGQARNSGVVGDI